MEFTQDKKTEEDLICGYLKGDLTIEETRRLIEWIRLDKANKQIYDEYCEIWITIQSSTQNPGYNAQEGFWKFRQMIKNSDHSGSRPLKLSFLKTAVRYAAIFIFAFFSGGILFYQFADRRPSNSTSTISELVVPLGSRAQYTLPDSTVVTLNAGSTLRIDNQFGIKDRIVEIDGEGYFKVAKDKIKPFIVKTPYLNVTALGTEFNVKAYSIDKTIETTLVNGSVKIEPNSDGGKGEVTILRPNQKLTFYKEDPKTEDNSKKLEGKSQTEIKPVEAQSIASAERVVKENVNIEPVVSWKESRWIFEDQSLAQMAVDLERKFDIQILFASENLKAYRFTGTILAEPIEQVLEVMSFTAPIHFKLNGKVVTLSEDKNLIEVNKNLYLQPK
jgi:transmembrane sensor